MPQDNTILSPDDMPVRTRERRTMVRTLNYDDGSDRLTVDYDSARRFDDGMRYLRIKGVGEDTAIHLKDVGFLIEALQAAAELDEQVVD